MKRACIAAILAMASSPVWAQSNNMQVYGPGSVSCATYLQDRSLRINADGWILGFWTGSNNAGEAHTVGHSTDSRGIVGEVGRVCRLQPSMSLFETEKQVFEKMKSDGR